MDTLLLLLHPTNLIKIITPHHQPCPKPILATQMLLFPAPITRLLLPTLIMTHPINPPLHPRILHPMRTMTMMHKSSNDTISQFSRPSSIYPLQIPYFLVSL